MCTHTRNKKNRHNHIEILFLSLFYCQVSLAMKMQVIVC